MLKNYDFVNAEGAELLRHAARPGAARRGFRARLCEARGAARQYQQQQVLTALDFKCDVLWSQLDALHYAYVAAGQHPAGRVPARRKPAVSQGAMGRRSISSRARDWRRGVRLKYDEARDRWVVLAPERVLMPDETALEVLQRLDGEKTVDALVGELVTAYDRGSRRDRWRT